MPGRERSREDARDSGRDGKRRAVFLDRDGTLIVDIPFNQDPLRVQLERGVIEGLRLLQGDGFNLVVVSNQSGIAEGKITRGAFEVTCNRMVELLRSGGVIVDAIYFCPHPRGPEGESCDCRKPKPGMLMTASKELNIDLRASWLIGDILHDVEAGNRAGCRSILIDNGNETEWLDGEYRNPCFRAGCFMDAATWIISQEREGISA